MTDALPAYADPDHPFNDASHHTGRACIEKGCGRPAGTQWSPHWCQPCNAARMERIGAALDAELARHTTPEEPRP